MNNESGTSSIELGISANEATAGIAPTLTDKYTLSLASNHEWETDNLSKKMTYNPEGLGVETVPTSKLDIGGDTVIRASTNTNTTAPKGLYM